MLPSLGGLGALQGVVGQLHIEGNLVLTRLGLVSLDTLGVEDTEASDYEVHICANPLLPVTDAEETLAQTNRSLAESNVVVDDACP